MSPLTNLSSVTNVTGMEEPAQHILDQLPELLAEIASAAGIDAALRLASEYGGRLAFIPAAVEEKHWLSQCVGLSAAQAICRCLRTPSTSGEYRGDNHLIPMGRGLEHLAAVYAPRANQAISASEIAKTHKIHIRTVRRRRARRRRLEEISGLPEEVLRVG